MRVLRLIALVPLLPIPSVAWATGRAAKAGGAAAAERRLLRRSTRLYDALVTAAVPLDKTWVDHQERRGAGRGYVTGWGGKSIVPPNVTADRNRPSRIRVVPWRDGSESFSVDKQ